MQVYFLKPVGMAGPVKIGASIAPQDRMITYARWSPFKLEIAAQMPGGLELERRFHAAFRFLHSHGEWFKGHPDISDVIKRINDGSFGVDELPPPKQLPRKRDAKKYNALAFATRGLCMRANKQSCRNDAPLSVRQAFERIQYNSSPDLQDFLDVWRWVEVKSPKPDSKSTIFARALLAQRAAA